MINIRNTKIILILVSVILGGCTYDLVNTIKGDFVRASLNTVPARVTKAWDFGYAIMICIHRTDEQRKGYMGDAVKITHPFFARHIEKKNDERFRVSYEFSDETMIYRANSIGMLACRDFPAKEIPVFSIEEMAKKDFVNEYPQAVYYQLKDNRVVSLGYFSAEKMFDKYRNLSIDLTGARTIVGRSGGNPLAAVFLPLTVVVDAIAGGVVVGGMAAACANEGCK